MHASSPMAEPHPPRDERPDRDRSGSERPAAAAPRERTEGGGMQKGFVVAIIGLVAVVAAYFAGYLPEHEARAQAEAQVQALEAKVSAAQARVRTGELLGQALTLREMALRQDYGQALELSSSFFDAVRGEAASSPDPALRDGLSEVLAKRDAVTAALAKGDLAVLETLHGIEIRLRRALGYATRPEPPPAAPPS